MKAPCVLFVDDEEGLLELYRTAFAHEGYEVRTATSLPAAREHLSRGGIDVVVLDIRLPDASGLDLLREIKAGMPSPPVVLSTAFARYQDEFSSWLADAYVVKSSDLGELKTAVAGCLERAR
ncbi:MAG: response regulator [Acidobacteriota bacterium]